MPATVVPPVSVSKMSETAGVDGEPGPGEPVAGPDGPWPAETIKSRDDADPALSWEPACCWVVSGARAAPEPASWLELPPAAWFEPLAPLVPFDGVGSAAGGGGELVATESVDDELELVEVELDEPGSGAGLPAPVVVPPAASGEPLVGEPEAGVPSAGAVASGSFPQAAGAATTRLARAISPAQANCRQTGANREDLAKEDPGP
jgi:hypothetical protein